MAAVCNNSKQHSLVSDGGGDVRGEGGPEAGDLAGVLEPEEVALVGNLHRKRRVAAVARHAKEAAAIKSAARNTRIRRAGLQRATHVLHAQPAQSANGAPPLLHCSGHVSHVSPAHWFSLRARRQASTGEGQQVSERACSADSWKEQTSQQ